MKIAIYAILTDSKTALKMGSHLINWVRHISVHIASTGVEKPLYIAKFRSSLNLLELFLLEPPKSFRHRQKSDLQIELNSYSNSEFFTQSHDLSVI